MARHKRSDCQVPPGGGRKRYTWRCPDCGRGWMWDPNAGTGADLWHGRDNVRNADGSKPTGGLWEWLTS